MFLKTAKNKRLVFDAYRTSISKPQRTVRNIEFGR